MGSLRLLGCHGDPIPAPQGVESAGRVGAGDSTRPGTSTPSPQPPASLLRPGWVPASPRPPSAKPGCEREREVRRHACGGCECGYTYRATRYEIPRLSPNSLLGPAAAPPLQGSLRRDKAAAASPRPRSASSPDLLSLPRPQPRPKGPVGRLRDGGDPKSGARSPCPPRPRPAPPLTCSALCGSSGARQPGRRRIGSRCRRRCPRPAGSRWWSPHGSAGLAAAAAAAAAAAQGGSSRWRLRRGGDQNAAGRIVRRLRARERAEDPAGRPRPGRRCCLLSGEAGRHPRLRPPPPSPPLTPLQSQCANPRACAAAAAAARPGSFLAASPSPGPPREVAAKGVARGREAAGRLGGRSPGFALFPRAQVSSGRTAAVVLAPPQPVPRSLGKLPSVSHGVRDRE